MAVWYASRMKKIIQIGLLVFPGVLSAETHPWHLSADTWAQPRDGWTVSRMQPLPDVVASWSEDPRQRLIIRYPGGEDGQLWAYELRSWLVSLGVPMESQEIVAGSEQTGRIEIELSR
jgi:hypothetical protein